MAETKMKQGSDRLLFEVEAKANVAVYLSWIEWSLSALSNHLPPPPIAFIKPDPDCTCPHRQESTLGFKSNIKETLEHGNCYKTLTNNTQRNMNSAKTYFTSDINCWTMAF